MSILFSNIPPLGIKENQKKIRDEIELNLSLSDKIFFAVGYVSRDSLIELARLVKKYNVQDVTLVIGMYAFDGIPEGLYLEVIKLQNEWQSKDIGNIYFVKNMNYHGKVYSFWKNGSIFKTIEGSANLSVLAPVGVNLRQYEIAMTIEDSNQNKEFEEHLKRLIELCTVAISELNTFKIIHEPVESLRGIENVYELTESAVKLYQQQEIDNIISFPIKAPKFSKRFSKERSDFAKSNINVCYGKGRKNQKGVYDKRNWYETQITVSKEVWSLANYPKDRPFFVITDDGYKFQAHTTSVNNKQFTAYDSDRIFGRWIKGRLVANGLLNAIDYVEKDSDKLGVVTAEMLNEAKMEVIQLTKTSSQELGRIYKRKANGRLDKSQWSYEPLDVWTIKFTENKRRLFE